MGDFLRSENAAGRGYLPAGDRVLRAFSYPFDAVRVLIVGQDPYPTPGHPVGLSFSVDPSVRPIPRSLVNIYKELYDDLGISPADDGDLTPWCEQGVMLLNRVLTVQPGKPASHRGKGWEEVTAHAIRRLAGRGGPLVAILWGRPAQAGRRADDRVPAPFPAFGDSRLLRVAPFLTSQRPPHRPRRASRRLVASIGQLVASIGQLAASTEPRAPLAATQQRRRPRSPA